MRWKWDWKSYLLYDYGHIYGVQMHSVALHFRREKGKAGGEGKGGVYDYVKTETKVLLFSLAIWNMCMECESNESLLTAEAGRGGGQKLGAFARVWSVCSDGSLECDVLGLPHRLFNTGLDGRICKDKTLESGKTREYVFRSVPPFFVLVHPPCLVISDFMTLVFVSPHSSTYTLTSILHTL